MPRFPPEFLPRPKGPKFIMIVLDPEEREKIFSEALARGVISQKEYDVLHRDPDEVGPGEVMIAIKAMVKVGVMTVIPEQ